MKLKNTFIWTIIILSVFFIGCTIHSNTALKDSTEHIRQVYNQQIRDIDTISSCKDTLDAINRDKVLQSESQSISEIKELITLHIDKIDNDYTLITLWAAVLSIIFLVFSFFSMYKIEETRKGMEELAKKQKSDADAQIAKLNKDIADRGKEIEEQLDGLDTALAESGNKIDNAIKDGKTKFSKGLKEYREKYQAMLDEFQELINHAKGGLNDEG